MPTLDSSTRAHQLQVVDHDRADVIPIFHSTSLRAKLKQRQSRRVVNKDGRVGEIIARRHQTLVILISKLAAAHPLRIDSPSRTQHSLHQLLLAHLKAEDHRGVPGNRHLLCNIQRKRRLPHRGTSRQDEQLTPLKTIEHFIEFAESCGHAAKP